MKENMDKFYQIIEQGKLLDDYVPFSRDEEKEICYYKNNIKKYCDKYGCNYNKFVKDLIDSPDFRFLFEKNSKKQSKEEKQQYEIIRSFFKKDIEKETGYKLITIGRSSGKGSKKEYEFRINEHGEILHGSAEYDSDPESKTFDTVISIEKNDEIIDIYVAQKDTGSGSKNSNQGGAQSLVGKEMGDTARYCLNNKDNAILFFFLIRHIGTRLRNPESFLNLNTLN